MWLTVWPSRVKEASRTPASRAGSRNVHIRCPGAGRETPLAAPGRMVGRRSARSADRGWIVRVGEGHGRSCPTPRSQ